MKFEKYLAEATGGNLFAIKLLGKWHEEVKLPYKDIDDLIKVANLEGGDVKAITDFFDKNYRVSGGYSVEDVSAKKKGSYNAVVSVKWTDSTGKHNKTTELEIAPE